MRPHRLTRPPRSRTIPDYDGSPASASFRARESSPAVTPADWLLFLLALEDAVQPLDPVRLQKGMFLFAEQAHLPPSQRYQFKPYDYGPLSPAIYSDLETLHADGLLIADRPPGQHWPEYRISQRGLQRARELLDAMAPEELAAIRTLADIKSAVLSRDFRDLLLYVYERHPEYARNSVFRF